MPTASSAPAAPIQKSWYRCLHVRGPILKSPLFTCLSWLVVMAQTPQDTQKAVAALEQQVQAYLQQQKPQLAIPVLRELVLIEPRNVNAQANLGVLLFFQGGYSEAMPHMRAALQLQPDLWRVEALLGIAEKRSGDPKLAQDDLERAFTHVDDKKIQIQAGLELMELDSAAAQLSKALAVAAKLEELTPEDPQILFAASELSRQMMNQSLLSMAIVGPDSAEMHMMMAGELGRQGDIANAVTQFREALRLNPNLPGAHFELAEQLRRSSDPALNAQAEGEYRAALKVNPYDELAWRQFGGLVEANGDFKTAEEYYRRALTLQPTDSEAQTGLAIALISMNRTSEAISLLESAVKEDPTNTVAHFRLSMLYRRAGRAAEAQHELDEFQHYNELKDKLGKVFKQLATPKGPK